jgi:hypothetical protein
VNEPGCGVAPSGVVRLSFRQLKGALDALLGAPAADEITVGLDLPTNEQAEVPSFSLERPEIADTTFTEFDLVAQRTGAYVRANVEAVTGCTADPTDECARAFVADFAERAFRKTAEGAELDLVLGVYDGGRADLGASVVEALEAGVYAVLESPRFTYRFELGAADAAAGKVPLEPHEVANALSFFLTAGPPDAELLAAAAAGTLTSPADLEPHVARLLAGDAARARLQAAVGAHLRAWEAPNVVLDPAVFPGWNAGLATAMAHETRLFLAASLWTEPLPALLTSRTTFVNAELAAVYGVPFPPADDALDGEGFGRVELPEQRSGLLTQGATLVVRSTPSGSSILRRSLGFMPTFLGYYPEVPGHGDSQEIADAVAALSGVSDREQAAYRWQTASCVGCHAQMDPYGIAFEEFDGMGASRTVDEQGRPVDASTTLPDAVGGAQVTGAAELGRALAERDDFARALGATFLKDALSSRWVVERPTVSCEVDGIVREFEAGDDRSFAGLVRAIALSPIFRERAKP